jgi:hypothetical protein
VLLFSAPTALSQTASLTLGSASGQPGAAVSVPLSYSTSTAQASALIWTFAYSPADITNVSVATGQASSAAQKSVACSAIASGRYKCIVYGLNRNLIGNGTVATATFTLAANTVAASTTIGVENSGASSAAGTAVNTTSSGTAITIVRTVSLSSLGCNPATITVPGSSQCTVSLTGPAASSGFIVSLGYSAAGASVTMPTSLTVPAGSTSRQFTLQVSSATAATSAQITATAAEVTKTTSVAVSPQQTNVNISVSPSTTTLTAGQTRQFTATVTGTPNTAVTWSVNPLIGNISASGLYTAPSVTSSRTVTVRATSVADATKSATSTVVVNPPAPPPPPSSGLVAAYSFNEGSGTTVADASGNGNTGTIVGATRTNAGKYGRALSFNGTSSYVNLRNRASLRLTGSMTWSAWVRPTANPANDGQIIAKSDGSAGWQLKSSPATGPQTFGVAVSRNNSSHTQRYSRTVRSLNTWYHIAGVYNAAARTLDIYVNGVLDNGVLRGTVPGSQFNANLDVYIGRRSGRGNYFNGIIDQVRIYNRALSAAEIRNDMNTPIVP